MSIDMYRFKCDENNVILIYFFLCTFSKILYKLNCILTLVDVRLWNVFFAVVIAIWCAAALSCGDERKTKLQLLPLFSVEHHVLQWGKCSAYLFVYLTSHVFGGVLVRNIKRDFIQTSALSCTNSSFINDILAWGRNHNKAIYKWSQ